ncbi:MAG: M16 family metallopeptidase [Clostridium sp.]
MEKIILENGLKILYSNIENQITSFTIAIDAGAIKENNNELGLSHVVEHMVFKGTKNKNEIEINKKCDEIFGFHNAMTNYPYVVYYGTSLSENFEEGLRLYGDIVLNPSFEEKYFKEEISVICEELKEWSDDLAQHCEDRVLYNGFNNRRIKELIIGREELIKRYTIKDVKKYHKRYYNLNNMVISVVSSKSVEEVVAIVSKCFNNEKCLKSNSDKKVIYETNIGGIFNEKRKDINSSKIQYIYPIHNLTDREITILRVFNNYFGEGTSSVLYDEIRTKRGLVYDIAANIKNEIGIKLYTITLGTSKENIDMAIEIINSNIKKVLALKNIFTKDTITKILSSLKLKRMLVLEKSITLSFNTAVYELMYGDGELILNEFNIENITEKEILDVANKVFVNPTIQIITS